MLCVKCSVGFVYFVCRYADASWEVVVSPRFLFYFASMKKIKLFIPVSLDGYIARIYGGFDLLENFSLAKGEDWGKKAFYDSIDTVILGRNTYYDLLELDTDLPFKGKEVYVLSGKPIQLQIPGTVHFIPGNVVEKIIDLKNQAGKDIYVFGGGVLITSLLEKNLIDSMVINYVPVMIGEGIPLFPKYNGNSKWKLVNSQSFKNGILQTEYELI